MKVVKQKSTGAIVYRSDPEFEPGKGIMNASRIKNIPESDLEEVDIIQSEWDEFVAKGKIQEIREEIIE